MYCNKCGNAIPDGANVCGYCGSPVCSRFGSDSDGTARQNVYGETPPSYAGQSGGNTPYSFQQTSGAGYGYGAPVNPVDGGAVGMAVTSLVLGIAALLMVCCVSIWWLTVLLAIVGIVFGAVSLGKHMGGRGLAIAGLICSIAALVVEVVIVIVGVGMFAAFFSSWID